MTYSLLVLNRNSLTSLKRSSQRSLVLNTTSERITRSRTWSKRQSNEALQTSCSSTKRWASLTRWSSVTCLMAQQRLSASQASNCETRSSIMAQHRVSQIQSSSWTTSTRCLATESGACLPLCSLKCLIWKHGVSWHYTIKETLSFSAIIDMSLQRTAQLSHWKSVDRDLLSNCTHYSLAHLIRSKESTSLSTSQETVSTGKSSSYDLEVHRLHSPVCFILFN